MKPRETTMLQFANQVTVGSSSNSQPRGRPANLFAKRLSVRDICINIFDTHTIFAQDDAIFTKYPGSSVQAAHFVNKAWSAAEEKYTPKAYTIPDIAAGALWADPSAATYVDMLA